MENQGEEKAGEIESQENCYFIRIDECYVCLWVANKAEETHFVQVRILTGVTVHLAPDILTSGVGSIDSDAHVRSGL